MPTPPSVLSALLAPGCCAPLALILVAPAGAQSDGAIEFPIRYDVGDRWRIVAERNISEVANGQEMSAHATISSTYELNEADDYGYSATWIIEEVEVSGDGSVGYAISPEDLIGEPIEYSASADGAPLEIVNWDEVLDSLLEDVDRQLSSSREEIARQAAREVITSWGPELGAQLILKDAFGISLCQGLRLEPNIPQTYETVLPNPFGGEAIAATGEYVLTSIDSDANIAEIHWRLFFDPDSAMQILEESLQGVVDGVEGGSSSDDLSLEGVAFDRQDSAVCLVDTESGNVVKITHHTSILVANNSREEVATIERRAVSPR